MAGKENRITKREIKTNNQLKIKLDMKIELKITNEAGNVQLYDVSGSLHDAQDDMILELALGMTEAIHGKLTDVNEDQDTIADCYDFIRHFVKSNDR